MAKYQVMIDDKPKYEKNYKLPLINIVPAVIWSIPFHCQTAHCGRHKPHFDFGVITSPIVPYRNLPQTLRGMTADCRSLV